MKSAMVETMSDSGLPRPDILDYDPSKYPFCSKSYDPETTNGLQIQDIVENVIRYSGSSLVDVFEVINGKGELYRSVSIDEEEVSGVIFGPKTGSLPRIRVFFATQDPSHRVPVSLTKPSFIRILEENCVPPSFVEVFVNNNGAYTSFTSYTANSTTPEAFRTLPHLLQEIIQSIRTYKIGNIDIYIALPMAPALNGVIYFRYNIESKIATCLVFGTFIEQLERRLQQAFAGKSSSNTSYLAEPDPFIIIGAIFAEYSSILEDERRRLDVLVREKESKTGITAHYYDKSFRASVAEYASLTKDFHICQGFLMFFERTVEYQVGCIDFLLAQHSALNTLQSQALTCEHPEALIINNHRVHDCLNLSASFSRNRVCQVKTLSRRMEIQLNVIRNLIAQNDSRTSISISELSSSIAISTKRDSEVMKSIAVLTMIFLPGTFVSTFFAMPFFHIGPASELDPTDSLRLLVDGKIWLYPAVTLPLTFFVFGAWWGWSWAWVRRRKDSRGSVLETAGELGERRGDEDHGKGEEGEMVGVQWKLD